MRKIQMLIHKHRHSTHNTQTKVNGMIMLCATQNVTMKPNKSGKR